MKLDQGLKNKLEELNAALMQGEEWRLGLILQDCVLEDVLSEQSIAYARSMDKKPLVLLLCSLAVSNDIEPMQAQLWMDAYQSIVRQALTPALRQRSRHQILRTTVAALADPAHPRAGVFKNVRGSRQEWRHALELAIDCRDWTLALNIAEAAQHNKVPSDHWAVFAQSLSHRHDMFVDATAMPKPGINYDILSKLYGMCRVGTQGAKEFDIQIPLRQLQASALEIAGDYQGAIDTLQYTTAEQLPANFQQDLARCLCKQGHLAASIETLDRVLAGMSTPSYTQLLDQPVIEGFDVHDEDKAFDVNKASRTLSDLTQVLKRQGLKCFLVSGTLLGYAREGQLLSHDKDIDVGILGWEHQFDLASALTEDGLFIISSRFLKGKNTVCMPIRHRLTGYCIDVFLYHPEGNSLVTGVDFFFGYRQTFQFSSFELAPVEFLGVEMYVPADVDLNLSENFGDWRRPDPDYISHLESPSTMGKGELPYMLTARLTALNAINKHKPGKLRKVVDLMKTFQDRPHTMDEALCQQLLELADRMEGIFNPDFAVLEDMEFSHA